MNLAKIVQRLAKRQLKEWLPKWIKLYNGNTGTDFRLHSGQLNSTSCSCTFLNDVINTFWYDDVDDLRHDCAFYYYDPNFLDQFMAEIGNWARCCWARNDLHFENIQEP